MNLDRAVMRFAGILILATLFMGMFHSPAWLWLTAFVGANLIQASFTGFCPIVFLLKRMGIPPGSVFK